MRVDEQVVERELVGQIPEAIVHQADVVALAQYLRDLAGLQAGRHQPDAAARVLYGRWRHLRRRLMRPAQRSHRVVVERPQWLVSSSPNSM